MRGWWLGRVPRTYRDLDVLHVGYHLASRHSILKIIENVITGCPTLRQNWLSFSPRSRGFDESRVVRWVRRARPKILHLHFSSLFDPALLDKLEPRPAIVATVHGEVESPYRDRVDLLICIHEACYERNRGDRVLIENTPHVDRALVRRDLRANGEVAMAARFSRDAFSERTIAAYGRIAGRVHLYGYTPGLRDAAAITGWCRRQTNLTIHPWSRSVESEIVRHSVFALLPAAARPRRSFGMGVMEAAALSIPVVTEPRTTRQSWVIDGFNGFLAESEDLFVRRCNQLLGDPALYAEIKRNALVHGATLRNSMPAEYEAVYRRFLGGAA